MKCVGWFAAPCSIGSYNCHCTALWELFYFELLFCYILMSKHNNADYRALFIHTWYTFVVFIAISMIVRV